VEGSFIIFERIIFRVVFMTLRALDVQFFRREFKVNASVDYESLWELHSADLVPVLVVEEVNQPQFGLIDHQVLNLARSGSAFQRTLDTTSLRLGSQLVSMGLRRRLLSLQGLDEALLAESVPAVENPR